MTLKVIVAVLLIVVPVCAQAQKPRVTKDDAQKVVTIISDDKAKTQTYCELTAIGYTAGGGSRHAQLGPSRWPA